MTDDLTAHNENLNRLAIGDRVRLYLRSGTVLTVEVTDIVYAYQGGLMTVHGQCRFSSVPNTHRNPQGDAISVPWHAVEFYEAVEGPPTATEVPYEDLAHLAGTGDWISG